MAPGTNSGPRTYLSMMYLRSLRLNTKQMAPGTNSGPRAYLSMMYLRSLRWRKSMSNWKAFRLDELLVELLTFIVVEYRSGNRDLYIYIVVVPRQYVRHSAGWARTAGQECKYATMIVLHKTTDRTEGGNSRGILLVAHACKLLLNGNRLSNYWEREDILLEERSAASDCKGR